MDVQPLILHHADLTNQLIDAYQELGNLHAMRYLAYAQSHHASEGLGVTERRERAQVACADLDAEISRAQGERDALRAEITHVELQLEHVDSA